MGHMLRAVLLLEFGQGRDLHCLERRGRRVLPPVLPLAHVKVAGGGWIGQHC